MNGFRREGAFWRVGLERLWIRGAGAGGCHRLSDQCWGGGLDERAEGCSEGHSRKGTPRAEAAVELARGVSEKVALVVHRMLRLLMTSGAGHCFHLV